MPKQLFRSANITVKAPQEKQDEQKIITKVDDVYAQDYQSIQPSTSQSFGTESNNKYQPPQPLDDARMYAESVVKVIGAVQQKKYEDAESLFTPEGLDIYNRLLSYGSAKLVGTPQLTFYKNGDKVVGRGVQMAFSFKNGVRKQFVEDIVFTFNNDGKIEALAFGLGKTAEDDILNKGWWDENVRIAIMEFLENYKTAYALKRLDYIEGVFDKDAVIITGTIVKRPQNVMSEGQNLSLDEHQVVYKTHTKMEYITNLRRVFQQNEFINIRFADNRVKKMGIGGETYGIQISQDYYSSRYGDKGYLFLMVDMNNPEQPTIKVRTWQPKADVVNLGGDGIIGLEDF